MGSLAASQTNSPYFILAIVIVFNTSPISPAHFAGDIFHILAAAAMIIDFAIAPALRSLPYISNTL